MSECSVCQDIFKDPRVLQGCGHSFCLQCLEAWASKSASEPTKPDVTDVTRKREFPCPKCRHSCLVPAGGVKEFVVNYDLIGAVTATNIPGQFTDQDTSKKEKTASKIKCEDCEQQMGYYSCVQCGDILCIECGGIHQRMKVSRNHTLLKIDPSYESKDMETSQLKGCDETSANKETTEGKTEEVKTLCSKHRGEIVKLYCTDCDVVMCSDCFILDHRAHNFLTVEEKYEKEVSKIKENIALSKMAANKVRFNKFKVDIMKSAKHANTVELILAVEKREQRFIQDVKKYFQNVISDIKQKDKICQEELEQTTKKLNQWDFYLSDLSKKGEEIIGNVSMAKCIESSPSLMVDFKGKMPSDGDLTVPHVVRLRLSPYVFIVDKNMKKQLGFLEKSDPVIVKSTEFQITQCLENTRSILKKHLELLEKFSLVLVKMSTYKPTEAK